MTQPIEPVELEVEDSAVELVAGHAAANIAGHLPAQFAYFLRCKKTDGSFYADIFMVLDNGVIRHALPVEYTPHADSDKVRVGDNRDFMHAQAYAQALRK